MSYVAHKISLLILLFSTTLFAQFTEKEKDSKQSSLFPMPSTQLPAQTVVQDGPVDPKEYVIGPGDIFTVSIWAATPLMFQVPVTPEGTVVVPTVNEVHVAGITLDSARKVVLGEIRKKYIAGTATFTLSTPRKFTVTISGVVLNEGKYTVQATQRVDAVLQLANDRTLYKEKSFNRVPDKLENEVSAILTSHSRRQIKIIRRNGMSVNADIEKYYATQNSLYNPLLQDGDNIVIPPTNLSKNFIGVYGAVAKEGVYEYVAGDSLTTLIAIAGGLTSLADPQNVVIARSTSEGVQTQLPVDLSRILSKESPDMPLQNGDRIIVAKKNSTNRGGVVSVEGEVVRPGSYAITQDSTTLTEVITKAGGFTPFASLSASKILRPSVEKGDKDITFQLLRKGYTTAEDTAYLGNEIALKTIGELVSINFVELFEQQNKLKDITLRHGDRIIIAAKANGVYVFGEVKNPGYVPFQKGKTYDYYIALAGGETDNAQNGDIRIIKASTKQWLDPDETVIEEGDYVWVPKEPYRPFGYYLDIYSRMFGIVGTVATLYLLIKGR